MINQFRTLNPFNLLLLVLVAVFLRLGVIYNLPQSVDISLVEPYTGTLFNLPADFFSPFSAVFYALILTFFQSLLLNRIVNNYNLLPKPTFLPALMFMTMSALLPSFLILSQVLIANFFMLWLIEKFLSIYRKDKAISVIFDMGMIVGAGTLVYFPFLAMLPLLWFVLIIFRPFNWREWVAGIIGFLTVCLLLTMINYLNGSWAIFIQNAFPFAKALQPSSAIDIKDYWVFLPVLFILFFSLLTISQKLNRSNVHLRKSYLTLLFMFFFALISVYIKNPYHTNHFLLTVAPVSVFMAHYFISAQKRWFYESLYFILVTCILYFQFF
ncbi:DUF6427 family protein [Arcticibacter eurypsychrophilus]|uniref:DUF6427 family protein n=1 Tax=Arcticibacter eurypsychrophilus TaxID=1434752 RepID=UPI00084DFB21|nr:DUF6427 family protein [Arcticibacter eurypsychrophilus]